MLARTFLEWHSSGLKRNLLKRMAASMKVYLPENPFLKQPEVEATILEELAAADVRTF